MKEVQRYISASYLMAVNPVAPLRDDNVVMASDYNAMVSQHKDMAIAQCKAEAAHLIRIRALEEALLLAIVDWEDHNGKWIAGHGSKHWTVTSRELLS